MVIDNSAVMAVMFDEPDQAVYLESMLHAEELLISAATLFECRLVALRRSGEAQESRLIAFIAEMEILVEDFDEAQAALAAGAFRRYGKGRDKAALNFGDCFSYALAKSRGEPLLYKGGDFARTDAVAAI